MYSSQNHVISRKSIISRNSYVHLRSFLKYYDSLLDNETGYSWVSTEWFYFITSTLIGLYTLGYHGIWTPYRFQFGSYGYILQLYLRTFGPSLSVELSILGIKYFRCTSLLERRYEDSRIHWYSGMVLIKFW